MEVLAQIWALCINKTTGLAEAWEGFIPNSDRSFWKFRSDGASLRTETVKPLVCLLKNRNRNTVTGVTESSQRRKGEGSTSTLACWGEQCNNNQQKFSRTIHGRPKTKCWGVRWEGNYLMVSFQQYQSPNVIEGHRAFAGQALLLWRDSVSSFSSLLQIHLHCMAYWRFIIFIFANVPFNIKHFATRA